MRALKPGETEPRPIFYSASALFYSRRDVWHVPNYLNSMTRWLRAASLPNPIEPLIGLGSDAFCIVFPEESYMLKSRKNTISDSKAKSKKRFISKAAELSRAHNKGSYATRESAHYILMRIACVCKSELNIQINDIGDIRPKTAYRYVQFMLKRGVSKKTLPNHFSHIRNYFRNAKLPLHLIPSNHDLGISGAPRRGTHKSLHMQDFEAANVNVDGNQIIINKGVLLAIRLQIWLGLRRKEAIFAYKNLPFWRVELRSGCHRISILGSAGPKMAGLAPLQFRLIFGSQLSS